MPRYCWMDGPYDEERYGPYATREEQLDGFFRLVVSATVAKDGYRTVMLGEQEKWDEGSVTYGAQRTISPELQQAEATAAQEQQPGAWDRAYKDRLYADDAFCRAERERWMRQQQWEEDDA